MAGLFLTGIKKTIKLQKNKKKRWWHGLCSAENFYSSYTLKVPERKYKLYIMLSFRSSFLPKFEILN